MDLVDDEIVRLKEYWSDGADGDSFGPDSQKTDSQIAQLVGEKAALDIDLFDKYLLMGVSQVCKGSSSMADAGRKLFNVSRQNKKSNNDSHRLKQILAKYDLSFDDFG